ncbi:MAG: RDD family protein [Gammaproteobacteria bacterium]|jgi:uncharacterized RDD family membrane protein YckC|nr:RDD family protein [Gammaproteobacteria bacterium]MBT4494244.1 RDD family protein [Gammaproteobacteria bacterium]MBT7370576.1 RDD family protein [Gammaproteobacteria bacterium]
MDDDVQYLGFWARFVAFLIDSTAASIILAPVVARVLGELVISDYDLSDQAQLMELLQRLTTQMSFDLLLMGTIFILFWIFKNATPGKMLFKSVIVDAKSFGPPSTAQNIIRYLAYYISLLPLGLGFIWIGFDRRKQGWHDKIARTVVIKGKPHIDENEQP